MNFAIFGIGLMATGEGVRVWSLLLEYAENMLGCRLEGAFRKTCRHNRGFLGFAQLSALPEGRSEVTLPGNTSIAE